MAKCNMEERVQKCRFETDLFFDELFYQWIPFDIFVFNVQIS